MVDWKTRRYQIKTRTDFVRMCKRRSLRGNPFHKRKPDFKWGLEKRKQELIQKKIPARSCKKWHGKAFLKTIPKGGYK